MIRDGGETGHESNRYSHLGVRPPSSPCTPIDAILRGMFRWVLVLLVSLAPAVEAVSAPVTISAIEWARPRHGEAITRLPGLAGVVRDLLDSPEKRLLIHYPGGEEGMLWAEELRSWLVALGIDSSRIEMLPGTASPDAIELNIGESPNWQP